MIELNNLFSDGAVFQRRKPIAVFGRTDAKCLIMIEFAGSTNNIRSDNDGRFLLYLDPVEAGGPYTMTVTNDTTCEKVRNPLYVTLFSKEGGPAAPFEL